MSSVKRSRRTAIAVTAAVLLALPLLSLSPPAALALRPLPTSALDWNEAAGGGFSGAANEDVYTLQAYGPYLYAGTYNLNGCELWRYDGAEWVNIVGNAPAAFAPPGFGDPNNIMLSGMAVFGDALYMGTSSDSGCEVWRYDGTSLSKLVGAGNPGDYGPGFGSANNKGVRGMQVFEGKLYIGTDNYGPGCEVWSYDGTSLSKLVGAGNPGDYGSGFGNGNNATAHGMGTYGGDLVIGTWNINQGCEVWSYDGTSLAQLAGDAAAPGAGFGNGNNYMAATIREFGGRMFVGTSNYSGCEVWSYDGSTWRKEVGTGLAGERGPGFGDATNEDAFRSQVFGTYLFYATYNPTFGAQVWRFDGSSWARECVGGIDSIDNQGIECFALYGASLYVGTFNPLDGAEVWSASYSFYFAEGYTGAGFQEYLCLGNPQDVDAVVIINYMFRDGTTQTQSLTVPANFRATVDVNAVVGADKEVSAKIDADQPIVAERPMYFDYQGNCPGGHDAVGAAHPSKTWCFAEGYTGPGFDEWICVLNPGGTRADLEFNFQTQEEGLKTVTGLSVDARSRRSFKVNDLLQGKSYQTSLELRSSYPVVAERPMYFNYQGRGEPRNWKGGHCVMGATELSREYYFAEGTTRGDFQEWITIQNAGSDPLTVNAVYQPAAGQGGNVEKSYAVEGGKRLTLFVPDEAGTDKDVSVKLSGSAPFLAERPMYFRYTGFGADNAGGDCAIGSPAPAAEWFFAEGYTGPGFQEWLTLQNPGDSDAQVEIAYFTQEAGALPARTVTVPARSRQNVRVNDDAGAGYQLSARLRVLSGPDIVAERPMYFDFRGIRGGHVVMGYAPGGNEPAGS